MNQLPKLRTRYGENVGVEIFITPPFLADNNSTFIATDAASGVSSFTVDNGLKFAVSQYALVGALGSEKSEIVKVHAVTTPTATVLTLAAATNFAHNRGEKITFIPYNQLIIERSTDGGSNYSTLATVGIRADSTETYYQDLTGISTYYYRAKFSNSTSSDVSQTSDAVLGTGLVANSAGAVIRDALITQGEVIDEVITKEFLFSALKEGRSELDNDAKVDRWSFRTEFDYVAGSVIPGHNRLTLPATLREPTTNKNILSIRIGKSKIPVQYRDKQMLNRWYEGVNRSTLNGAITTGSTSIVLTNSGDFDDSGAITIAGALVSDVLDTVDYTTNTPSTNTLGTVTGIQAAGHASGAIVWQGAAFGNPLYYTIDDGEIVFSQPFADDLAGELIYMDFYKKMTDCDSDNDLLDEPNYEMFIPYLRYRMKKRRASDIVRDNDDDWKSWVEKRDGMIAKEYTGQNVRIVVDIPN